MRRNPEPTPDSAPTSNQSHGSPSTRNLARSKKIPNLLYLHTSSRHSLHSNREHLHPPTTLRSRPLACTLGTHLPSNPWSESTTSYLLREQHLQVPSTADNGSSNPIVHAPKRRLRLVSTPTSVCFNRVFYFAQPIHTRVQFPTSAIRWSRSSSAHATILSVPTTVSGLVQSP